jgi:hypothetical protein
MTRVHQSSHRENIDLWAAAILASAVLRFGAPAGTDGESLKTTTVPLHHIARCGYYACNRQLEAPIMTRFMFLVLERHRVVAPTSARPLAAPVPAL